MNKTVDRIRLVSDNLYYGPCPGLDDEKIHRLTIRRDGRIYLTTYNYMEQELYRQWLRCEPERSGRLLGKIARRIPREEPIMMADVGRWTLQIIYEDGSSCKYNGTLHSGDIGLDNLTGEIRSLAGLPYLFGFVGENDRAVTLMDACKRALLGYEFIASIVSVKRGYVIMPTSSEETPGASPLIVHKNSGKVETFFPPYHWDELKAGRPLQVPHIYALPKMKI